MEIMQLRFNSRAVPLIVIPSQVVYDAGVIVKVITCTYLNPMKISLDVEDLKSTIKQNDYGMDDKREAEEKKECLLEELEDLGPILAPAYVLEVDTSTLGVEGSARLKSIGACSHEEETHTSMSSNILSESDAL
ncbi:hypothetical protein F5I97DRAFT_1830226 [Phlebopus sp. FC_14]|nr:hypothetical protein F5I97DRAFT_1830226 [Phlebopus sp. FC_14]